MDVTKLFEIGQVPFKIVEFTEFGMKQESQSNKKAIRMLTNSLTSA